MKDGRRTCGLEGLGPRERLVQDDEGALCFTCTSRYMKSVDDRFHGLVTRVPPSKRLLGGTIHLLLGSSRHEACMAYSSSRLRGSEAVISAKPPIHRHKASSASNAHSLAVVSRPSITPMRAKPYLAERGPSSTRGSAARTCAGTAPAPPAGPPADVELTQ